MPSSTNSNGYTISFLYKIVIVLIVLQISTNLFSQNIPGITVGGTMDDSGTSICSDGNGGFLLAGTTRSYGSGSNDVYVIKIGNDMSIEWSKTYGTSHQEFVRSVYRVSNGYIISGKSKDRKEGKAGVYFLNIDDEGNTLIEKTYGNEFRDIGHSIIKTSTDDILILGYTRTNVPYGAVRIIKIKESGDLIWDKIYGFDRDEYGYDIIEDSDGNYVFAGTRDGFYDDVHANFKNHDSEFWIEKVDTAGNEIFSYSYGSFGHDFGNCIEEVDDGYLYFGSTQSIGEGSFDMTLIQFSKDGDSLWQKAYGGEDFDYGLSMSVNNEDEVFLLGTSASFSEDISTDIYLLKTDIVGDVKWELTIGGDNDEWGNSVIHTNDGGCVIVGSTNSYGAGGNDVFYTRVSANGIIETYSDNVENIIDNQLIYPNPTRNYAKVKIPDGVVDVFKLNFYSISGVEVKSTEINSSSRQVNVSTLDSGTYIYTLVNTKNDTVLSGKLIIY